MKKFGKICLLIIPTIFLSSCNLPNAEDIQKKLIPNLGSTLTQLGALIFIIILIIVFGYKPIKKMIKKRQDYIESNIKEAEKQNTDASINLSQSKEALTSSKKEAMLIVDNATKEAEVERQKILAKAEEEKKAMLKQAEEEIKQMEKDAEEEIHEQMVSLALMASEELLKREVNEEDDKKFVSDFIKDIDK